ncbi:Prefoldin, subunit 4 [Ascodesmis nigricans]|uniref:Prefoldin subunit 4 n=1 Tax=Ascodesmis nigricans TaxID=341454 RepID=A0A4S2N4M1_9PEZI|nr:Prefoldin, subunit 4 [Ascodesmis nigricans]
MDHTRLLSREDEPSATETTVTRADQDNINLFSSLHSSLSSLEATIEALRTERETYTDASQELELADEDELVSYKLGDAFVDLKVEKVQKLLEKQVERVEEEIEDTEKKIDERRERMDALKKVLYGKFGRSINLDV